MRGLFLVVTLVSLSLVSKVNAAPQFDLLGGLPGAYEDARAVFIGEVVKYEPSASMANAEGHRFDKVTFRVEYSWKGAGFRDVGVYEFVVLVEKQPEFEGMEPYIFRTVTFAEGRKYLVFAYLGFDKKSLVVGPWSRSKPLWDATEDVKELNRITAPFPFRFKAPVRL